jgi:small multidrug resistance pump
MLAAAIVLEVAGTTTMKLSAGFSKLIPSLATLAFYALSLAIVASALRRLELSVAYAVWAGAGTALTAVIGLIIFEEALTPLKLFALALTVAGIACLHLAASGS